MGVAQRTHINSMYVHKFLTRQRIQLHVITLFQGLKIAIALGLMLLNAGVRPIWSVKCTLLEHCFLDSLHLNVLIKPIGYPEAYF